MPNAIQKFSDVTDLKKMLAGECHKQIQNHFGDERKALKFLSSVVAAAQRTPKLLECEPMSVINSFMTMASLQLMPSDVSGHAFVLPYNNKNGLVAQFQLGYKGMVVLAFRSNIVKDIACEIVFEKDKFDYTNGVITHTPDVFAAAGERGKPIGAYCIVRLTNGGMVHKVMAMHEILDIAAKFSKSFKSSFSPWSDGQDPQMWMEKKTVLRQTMKLVPQDDKLIEAIARDDDSDSIIGDRLPEAKEQVAHLTMGAILKKDDDKSHDQGESKETGEQFAAPPEHPKRHGKAD